MIHQACHLTLRPFLKYLDNKYLQKQKEKKGKQRPAEASKKLF